MHNILDALQTSLKGPLSKTTVECASPSTSLSTPLFLNSLHLAREVNRGGGHKFAFNSGHNEFGQTFLCRFFIVGRPPNGPGNT